MIDTRSSGTRDRKLNRLAPLSLLVKKEAKYENPNLIHFDRSCGHWCLMPTNLRPSAFERFEPARQPRKSDGGNLPSESRTRRENSIGECADLGQHFYCQVVIGETCGVRGPEKKCEIKSEINNLVKCSPLTEGVPLVQG